MKKQKAKKAGGAAKKKDDKAEAEAEAEASASADKAEEAGEGAEAPGEEKEVEEAPEATKPPHVRQPSVTLESRLRSPLSPTLKSPTLPPLSPGGDAVGDIYRKQALRIEELEKENKRLQTESSEAEARWKKTEEELEELREASGEVAELKSKADLVTTKGEEVEKLVWFLASLPSFLTPV